MSCCTDFINVADILKVKQMLNQMQKHWGESRLYGSARTSKLRVDSSAKF